MSNKIESIAVSRLIAHPGNPNLMSRLAFVRLVGHIKRTGRYEPVVVRPHPKEDGSYEILNGHHRTKALAELGHESADCIVWDADDTEVDILLATLNRLNGSDIPKKKIELLKRLSKKMSAENMAKMLPQNASEIKRLTHLKLPDMPAAAGTFAEPFVVFLGPAQKLAVDEAMSLIKTDETTKARHLAQAVTIIAKHYLDSHDGNE